MLYLAYQAHCDLMVPMPHAGLASGAGVLGSEFSRDIGALET